MNRAVARFCLPSGLLPGLVAALPVLADLNMVPDVRLFQSLEHLTAEERPARPIRMFGPGEPLSDYREFHAPTGRTYALTLQLSTAMMVHAELPFIAANRQNPLIRQGSLEHLASVIAHEQAHIGGSGESDAYRKQMDVLSRLNVRDKSMTAHVASQIDKFERMGR